MDLASTSASQNAPRAYINGFNLSVDYKMPDLSLVRSQAAKITEVMNAPIPPRIILQNARGEAATGPVPPALWYNFKLPQLFQFSFFCSVEDVPEDILPQCIWSLGWLIRAYLEASDEQLKIFALVAPQGQGNGVTTETERYILLETCRSKIADHLLKPKINQPLEALRYIRCSMEADKERSGQSDIFLINPGVYASFAVCLARARTDDVEAKAALSRVMNNITLDSGSLTTFYRAEAKVYLARVLRRLGEDDEAQKLEIWLVRWFKKHPHEFSDSVLVQMFTTDIDPAIDPVFTGLGGSKWLDHRKATLKTQIRETRNCRNCRAREPQVKLALCKACQRTFYCSTECQKKDWPSHKVYCREAAAYLKRTAELEGISAFAAQQSQDWMHYRDNFRPEIVGCFVNALGLVRDVSRGRTHIVYQEVEYVPSVKNCLDKFRTTGAGVFKLEDVWQDIESRMGLDPGEGKVYIREMLEVFDREPGNGQTREAHIPIFNLMFSAKNDVQVYLGISDISQKKVAFMRPKPDWRRDLNMRGEPPAHIKLGEDKIRDAEFIF